MKVTQYLAEAREPIISLEILPPTKGKSIDSIYGHLDPLMEFKPAFVNVTYHRAEQVYKKRGDGSFERVEIRKRPGTVGICAAIMNKYKVESIPHLICGGFSKEETENALIDLHFLGVKNVLALRGGVALANAYYDFSFGGDALAGGFGAYIGAGLGGAYYQTSVSGGPPIADGDGYSPVVAGMAGVQYDMGTVVADVGYRLMYLPQISNNNPGGGSFYLNDNTIHEVRGTLRYRFQ